MKITIKHDPEGGRKSHWLVTYHADGKRVRKYFKTQDEAKAYDNEVRHAFRTGVNPMDYEEALRLSAGTAYTMLELVRAGLEHLRSTANGHPLGASSAAIPHKAP